MYVSRACFRAKLTISLDPIGRDVPANNQICSPSLELLGGYHIQVSTPMGVLFR